MNSRNPKRTTAVNRSAIRAGGRRKPCPELSDAAGVSSQAFPARGYRFRTNAAYSSGSLGPQARDRREAVLYFTCIFRKGPRHPNPKTHTPFNLRSTSTRGIRDDSSCDCNRNGRYAVCQQRILRSTPQARASFNCEEAKGYLSPLFS
jgi:hypothetical protein